MSGYHFCIAGMSSRCDQSVRSGASVVSTVKR